jgi:hypothetical protein
MNPNFFIEKSQIMTVHSILKIQRAFCVFYCQRLDRMGINHCRPDITVPQQFLNSPSNGTGIGCGVRCILVRYPH